METLDLLFYKHDYFVHDHLGTNTCDNLSILKKYKY
jgi:hypothetical protein